MKIPLEIAEKVIIGSMKEMWDTFINMEEEYSPIEFRRIYNEVRFGKDVKFEIHDLWEDTKKIIRKDKDSIVLIFNGRS